eukprot:2051511-Rhodomonas_salina.1
MHAFRQGGGLWVAGWERLKEKGITTAIPGTVNYPCLYSVWEAAVCGYGEWAQICTWMNEALQ